MARSRQRARKAGKREPNGQLQREKVSEIKAIAHRNRRRMGANSNNVESANWESAIGRAYERGQIKKSHLEAGQQYQRVCVSFARIKGIPSPFPRSVELMAELRGKSDADFDSDFVGRIINQMQDSFIAVNSMGRDVATIVHNVVKDDVDCGAWPCHQINKLTTGLDLLVDYFQIPRGEVDARG